MHSKEKRRYLLIGGISMLFLGILLAGCLDIQGINSSRFTPVTPSSTSIPLSNSGQEKNNSSINAELPDPQLKEQIARTNLDSAWKTLRLINTDANERYLTLDVSKSEDINYLRYQLVPLTISRIIKVRENLEQVKPVTPDQYNETQALIAVTNYSVLKYEGLSTMLHATQYATIRDPVRLKSELRKAKFTLMDALDIINAKEISAYPSRYRDQVAADKREIEDMAAQVEGYTMSVYMASVY